MKKILSLLMLLGLNCGNYDNPVDTPKATPIKASLELTVKENRNHLALAGIPIRIYRESKEFYPASWTYTGLNAFTNSAGSVKFDSLCTVYQISGSEPDTAERYMAYAESTSGYSQGSIIVTPTSTEPNLVKEIYVIPK